MPVPVTDIKALREQRAKIVIDAQELLKKPELTEEDDKRFDEMMAEADKLKARIDREERLLDLAEDVDKTVERRAGRETPGGEGGTRGGEDDGELPLQAREEYAKAFRNYLRYGAGGLDPDESKLLRGGFRNAAERRENRAQTTTTTGGGYLIPTTTLQRLDEALQAFGGVREVAFNLRTDTGNAVNWPTLDDTGNSAAIVAENIQVTATDFVFGQKTLNAYMYRTMALVPLELLQDSLIDIDMLVTAQFGTRLGRGLNAHFTTGTNSGQPNGVVTASNAGATAAASNAVAFNDLLNLQHALDPAYRMNARWMMADSTLKLVKQIKDDQNRPLFLPGLALKEPDTILGYSYVINQQMAAVEASAKSILFGDFSKYIVRDVVGSMMLMRLTERFADYGQVGYILFSRHDGELAAAQATTLNPIQHLVHPSP